MAPTAFPSAAFPMKDSMSSRMAYLDCPTGIAGDMCLGAIVDAGMPLAVLTEQLSRLGLNEEYRLVAQTVQRQSQVATLVRVQLTNATPSPSDSVGSPAGHGHDSTRQRRQDPDDEHVHGHGHEHTHDRAPLPHHASGHSHSRHLPEIEALIETAQLTHRAKTWSLAIFRRLAAAEAAVHGIPPEQVHFHEVGATDAIVDIVGTCIGLDWLGIEQIYCSALPVGGGTVMAAHGRLPVPAPAVLRLLTQARVQVYSNGIDKELVTPTGAAISTTLAESFGPPPSMVLTHLGHGAGGRDLPIANVLRLWIGQAPNRLAPANVQADRPVPAPLPASPPAAETPSTEAVVELQTQVDDLTPQAVGYLYEPLFEAGALDVFTQSVGMKKNRPGLLLTVICRPEQAQSCTDILFRETTTLGVRQIRQQRQYLHREYQRVSTPYGEVQIKVARAYPGGPMINLHPEYEDCARCAKAKGVAWKQVHQGAIAQAIQQLT